MGREGRGVPARGVTNCDWGIIKARADGRVVSSRERRLTLTWRRVRDFVAPLEFLPDQHTLPSSIAPFFFQSFYRFIVHLTGAYFASKGATHTGAVFGYFAHTADTIHRG
jgi:hypothetical protein